LESWEYHDDTLREELKVIFEEFEQEQDADTDGEQDAEIYGEEDFTDRADE
jgi:RecB family endonuclease NucS